MTRRSTLVRVRVAIPFIDAMNDAHNCMNLLTSSAEYVLILNHDKAAHASRVPEQEKVAKKRILPTENY